MFQLDKTFQEKHFNYCPKEKERLSKTLFQVIFRFEFSFLTFARNSQMATRFAEGFGVDRFNKVIADSFREIISFADNQRPLRFIRPNVQFDVFSFAVFGNCLPDSFELDSQSCVFRFCCFAEFQCKNFVEFNFSVLRGRRTIRLSNRQYQDKQNAEQKISTKHFFFTLLNIFRFFALPDQPVKIKPARIFRALCREYWNR